MSRNVPPSVTANHITYRASVNSEPFTNGPKFHTRGKKSAGFPNGIFSQFGAVLLRSPGVSPLLYCVVIVVCLSAKKEVFDIAADGSVTMVANLESFGDGPVNDLPSHPMGENVLVCAESDHSIPVAFLRACPVVTPIGHNTNHTVEAGDVAFGSGCSSFLYSVFGSKKQVFGIDTKRIEAATKDVHLTTERPVGYHPSNPARHLVAILLGIKPSEAVTRFTRPLVAAVIGDADFAIEAGEVFGCIIVGHVNPPEIHVSRAGAAIPGLSLLYHRTQESPHG